MKKYLLMLTTAVLIFGACSSDKDDNGGITIPDSKQLNQEVYADETRGGINFTATGDWTATVTEKTVSKATAGTSGPEWIALSQYSGSAGTYSLVITMSVNTTGKTRAATILIKSGSDTIEITVTQ